MADEKNPSRTQTVTQTQSQESGSSTTEYILLSESFVQYEGPEGKEKPKTYKKGQRVPLSPGVATTLLSGPRPSVREVTEEDRKKEREGN